jgi:hypothetical protein
MKEMFWALEKLGRVRLSEHFYFRQFLYSEIGAAFGITNLPDFPDIAIETGTRLCEDVLEPLQRHVGQLVIRSGFRSARLNAFGAERRLKCGANEGNFAYHIWDHLDASGHKGAAACVVAPRFNDLHPGPDGKFALARVINEHINFHSVTFFAHDNALNIGWHERPVRTFYPRHLTPQ